MTHAIDIAAAVIGTVMGGCQLFQLKRILHRRHSDDVSLTMLSIVTVGACVWLIYGIAHRLPEVIVANAVGVASSSITLFMAWLYRSERRGRKDG
jgi:MtN3 and saliva related transmembrane protein